MNAAKALAQAKNGNPAEGLSPAQKKLLQEGLGAAGVPKAATKLLTDTKTGQKLLNEAAKRAMKSHPALYAAQKVGQKIKEKKNKDKQDSTGNTSATVDMQVIKYAGIAAAIIALWLG